MGLMFSITKNNAPKTISELNQAIQRGMTAVGLQAERYVKEITPVGTPESTHKKGYRGGTLRNSITHEVGKDSVTIGTSVEYAIYVEMGTIKMRAQPYLRPGIEDHMSEYVEILKNELMS